MTQDEIIEMAEQAGMTQDGDMWFSFGKGDMDVEHEHLVAFAKLVAEKATEEANARANASWTLMCEKMVSFEREAIIQIIKETLFDDCFQPDVIDAIRARGEQA
jgi:hypothetical protein